ncbi:MAG: DUF4350 domain-containing protein [Proteobacteria bacterium]|nr:DUF4350 domain-containing protein [Pseudomonadota bacterium]
MKDRLLALLFALGALLLFYLLFIGSPAGLRDSVTRPTSDAGDANGYLAARSWLQQQGVRVGSLRERYTQLDEQSPAAAGNLLVVTVPGVERFQTDELAALDRWVRAGNTLLVQAALIDAPAWADERTAEALADLESLTGLEFEQAAAQAPSRSDTAVVADHVVIRAAGSHPLTLGAEVLAVSSAEPPRSWLLRTPSDAFALALASEVQTGEGALFVRQSGSGRILILTTAAVFANSNIDRADNARLLANVVQHSIGADGVMLFDDLRQGAVLGYDVAQFWRDPRLSGSLLVLIVAWLIWVTGGTRLALPPEANAAPSTTDLLTAAGGMLSARLRPAAAAACMYEAFLRRVARLAGAAEARSTEQSAVLWSWLARQPRVSADDRLQLEQWYSAVLANKRVPLRELHNLFLRVDRQLST